MRGKKIKDVVNIEERVFTRRGYNVYERSRIYRGDQMNEYHELGNVLVKMLDAPPGHIYLQECFADTKLYKTIFPDIKLGDNSPIFDAKEIYLDAEGAYNIKAITESQRVIHAALAVSKDVNLATLAKKSWTSL